MTLTCGSCKYTDGCCYTSLPPKVRCALTGKFHYYEDECDCEDVTASKIEELEHIKKILNEPIVVNFPDTDPVSFLNTDTATVNIEPATLGVRCIICGEEFAVSAVSLYAIPAYICEDCKKAVKFIKEHFRYDEV